MVLERAMLQRTYGNLSRIILPHCNNHSHISWIDGGSGFYNCSSVNVSMPTFYSMLATGKLPECKVKPVKVQISPLVDADVIEAFNLNCHKHNVFKKKVGGKLEHLVGFLGAHRVHFSPSHGSLLAHYRFGQLVQPWDDDVDLMISQRSWQYISCNATQHGYTRVKANDPTFILSPVVTYNNLPACLIFSPHLRPGLIQVWWRRNCFITRWKIKIADIFVLDCPTCTPTPEQTIWLNSDKR